ncbi:golgin subfamily A member 3-like [Procambarus clarkii]|uniref:golgin subfamily A member 3-like n=1 Tax=Procambarus clarkii TaxID=6728 RepID=UPI003742966A
MAARTAKGTGKSQCDQMKEAFSQDLEDIRREMKEMNNTISNLQSELTAAKEEIKTLKENHTETEAQIIIQREDENNTLEGTAIVQATFAEMLKENKEVLSTVREVAMEAATSQEAAKPSSQLLERKISVVAVGIEDQEGSNRTEWNDKDREAIIEILRRLEMEGTEQKIEKVFRMGFYNKDRNRVIMIVFANEATKEKILTRKSHLQYVEELKKVFLQGDITREERAMTAEARKKRRVAALVEQPNFSKIKDFKESGLLLLADKLNLGISSKILKAQVLRVIVTHLVEEERLEEECLGGLEEESSDKVEILKLELETKLVDVLEARTPSDREVEVDLEDTFLDHADAESEAGAQALIYSDPDGLEEVAQRWIAQSPRLFSFRACIRTSSERTFKDVT